MRDTVRQRFRVVLSLVFLSLIAPAAWALTPTISFEPNAVSFGGFTPGGDIAVLCVVVDRYEDVQLEHVITRQFLLTADSGGAAEFVLHPGAEDGQYREFEPDGVWAAVDVTTGVKAIEKRGDFKDLGGIPAADVQFVLGQGTTDEIRTALPVAVMIVRPGQQALYNDPVNQSGTSIPLSDTDGGGGGSTGDGGMKPGKKIGLPVNRFLTGDVVIVIDRVAFRSLEKTISQ